MSGLGKNWPAIIINGFSGMGKSSFAKTYPKYRGRTVIDLDSHPFSHDEVSGNTFPDNYINAIKLHMESVHNHGAIILVSTHPVFLEKLDTLKMKHVVLVPSHEETADTWLKRIYEREGNGESPLYKKIQREFGEYLVAMGVYAENAPADNTYVIEMTNDLYLKDVIDDIIDKVG